MMERKPDEDELSMLQLQVAVAMSRCSYHACGHVRFVALHLLSVGSGRWLVPSRFQHLYDTLDDSD